MTIRSEEFDDIYFSPEDGVAETRHVFLAGNGLPDRWQGRDDFTIAETGFGTGLNFLCAWDMFEKRPGQGSGSIISLLKNTRYRRQISKKHFPAGGSCLAINLRVCWLSIRCAFPVFTGCDWMKGSV